MKFIFNKYLVILFILLFNNIAAASKTLPQLDFTKYPQQIFWLIITFALTYIFINKVVFPKILNIKQTRQGKILNNVEQTIKLKKDIDSINTKILQHKLNTKNIIINLNVDLAEKIASLTNKHYKKIDEYKKKANGRYNYKAEVYSNTNNLFDIENLQQTTNLIITKLNLTINENLVADKIKEVANK